MNKKTGFGVALLLAVAFTAFAQEYNSESDFKVKKEGSGITITKYVGTATVVNIPPTIQNLPVTSIGNNAFKGTKITSVTIPDGITSVGSNAFNTTSLTSITFQGIIVGFQLKPFPSFPGDLGMKFLTGGVGTYTRPSGSDTWTNPNSAIAATPPAASQNTGTASNQSILDRAAAARQQQVADEVAAEQSKTRPSGNNPLEGTTWIQSDGKGYQVLSFHGPLNLGNNNNAPVVILQWGDNIDFGNYTVSGDKVTISIGNRTGTISGNVITFSAWTFTQYGGPMPSVAAQSGGGPLVGTTWKQADGQDNDEIVFSGPSTVIWVENPHSRTPERFRGTYTVSGNKVTVTFEDIFPYPFVGIGTISGNTLSLSRDNEGGDIKDLVIPFTKQ